MPNIFGNLIQIIIKQMFMLNNSIHFIYGQIGDVVDSMFACGVVKYFSIYCTRFLHHYISMFLHDKRQMTISLASSNSTPQPIIMDDAFNKMFHSIWKTFDFHTQTQTSINTLCSFNQ